MFKSKATHLERCCRCNWSYPEDILSVLHGSLFSGAICGICAREVRRVIHGIDIPFRPGSMAAEYEQDAKRWRKKYPETKPKELCSTCNAELTPTDLKAGYCTQCKEKVK